MNDPGYFFWGNQLLMHEQGGSVRLPLAKEVIDLPVTHQFDLPEMPGVGGVLSEEPAKPWCLVSLRSLIGLLPEAEFRLAGLSWQWVEWYTTTRYCGRCGAETVRAAANCHLCPSCGFSAYPVIAPAVIVRIRRGERILLAQNRRFRSGYFSVLAGFVEPGETLEAAVMREIREEVGLEVTNLAYFGSQSWPFPHSLMIAFTADYLAGEIDVDGEEIVEANWFGRGQLPELPPAESIAGQLIQDFFAP